MKMTAAFLFGDPEGIREGKAHAARVRQRLEYKRRNNLYAGARVSRVSSSLKAIKNQYQSFLSRQHNL